VRTKGDGRSSGGQVRLFEEAWEMKALCREEKGRDQERPRRFISLEQRGTLAGRREKAGVDQAVIRDLCCGQNGLQLLGVAGGGNSRKGKPDEGRRLRASA
jgi:hypothetical protein